MAIDIFSHHWRVYHAPLRATGVGSKCKIIEIQSMVTGKAVLFWPAFDDSNLSKTTRLALARRIVRLHNEDLNRKRNELPYLSMERSK